MHDHQPRRTAGIPGERAVRRARRPTARTSNASSRPARGACRGSRRRRLRLGCALLRRGPDRPVRGRKPAGARPRGGGRGSRDGRAGEAARPRRPGGDRARGAVPALPRMPDRPLQPVCLHALLRDAASGRGVRALRHHPRRLRPPAAGQPRRQRGRPARAPVGGCLGGVEGRHPDR